MDSSSFHGKHLGRDPEIWHSTYDESWTELTHHARSFGKLMEPAESDGLNESVTEESAEESPIVRKQPAKRTLKIQSQEVKN